MTLAQACFRAPGSIPAAILNDLSPELRGSFLKRGMLVDVLIVCCLVLFCRVTLGTAQAAFYIWYSGALAMDAQRSAESSWSLYSTGSSAKSFAALRWGVSSLLESSLARVSRTLQILRLGPSALVDTLVTPSSQRPKEAHRGRRGGKREQRRRRTQEYYARIEAAARSTPPCSSAMADPTKNPSIVRDRQVDALLGEASAAYGSGRVVRAVSTHSTFLVDSPAS